MLILTRRIGEAIVFGEKEIEVEVLAVKGNHVRIGIKAPLHVTVHREEIYNRIKKAEEVSKSSWSGSSR